MSACSTPVSIQVQDLNQHSPLPTHADLSKRTEHSPLQPQEGEEDNEHSNGNDKGNVEEDEDEDEDADFNPFLKETHSVEASSSLSSEVEGLDTDVADSGKKNSAAFLKNSMQKQLDIVNDSHTIGDLEHDEEIVMQATFSSGEACGEKFDIIYETSTPKESVLIAQSENGSACGKENGLTNLTDVANDLDSNKLTVDMETEGAICMRTRARFSLVSFTLDELETFLQETDDEDDLQNVDDEEEYRKFLAAVLQGGEDSLNLRGNINADDEDEDEDNDADFELELEEALESDPDEIEERRMSRRSRRHKGSPESSSKVSGQLNRPLRPLLPFAPMGSFSAFDGKHLVPNIASPYIPPVNNGFNSGFTPHQIGQLHCLIHEHVQLLIQVFSLSVLETAKGHIAADVKELILEMLQKCDQALAWRSLPYPRFCFFPPCIHPSLPDELHKMLPLQCSYENARCDFSSGNNRELHSNIISLSNGRCKHLSNEQENSLQTLECTSWVPYICGPVLSILDVAPLRLVGSYVNDVYSAVRAYERYQIELGFESRFEKEPLFPLPNSLGSAEIGSQGEIRAIPPDSSGTLSSSSSKQMPKKTMAATLVEKAKKQSVALVPKEIAKLAQRFWPLFNPALYPHKPPPAPIANRVLFTDAEDELLALGLMEYNTDWKAIQQRFLPCKSKHQIFVRQKNRASSKAPENPIKAVRRMKNSPLTSEEIARIEVGLKKFKLDWISIWRFFVPYRDPSLLPRMWRIASGTQKSYKSDANKKAKRRLYEMRRKVVKPLASTLHSSSEKEGNSTDGVEDTNSGDNRMDTEDEAYVHEAFLDDWRPDNNISSSCPSHQLSQEGVSQAKKQNNNSVSTDIQHQILSKSPASLRLTKSQVILRPYRARRPNSARLVKLAPDLPPVNLPPSVRVMSQSAFKSSQAEISTKFSGNFSRIGGVAVTGIPQVGIPTKSGVDCSVKSGQITRNSVKITPRDWQAKHSDKSVADEKGDSDLQMHPLLFQAPQDGHLPYYPLNCRTSTSSSFTFFSGKQPQLNLSLFHNPRHIRDAVNFLSKSSKTPEKNSSSCGVDFHPLLQRTDDLLADSIAAPPAGKLLDNVESSQRHALIQNPSLNDTLSASGVKITSPSGKVNELDLDIHLSFTSTNQEAFESRNMIKHGMHRSVHAPVSRTMESESATNDLNKKSSSAPDGISSSFNSGDNSLVKSRNKGIRKVADNVRDESFPEIVMEQEELSDSEEEFGENVEFECEEMADSEGDDTSDSEQFVNVSNEEMQVDEMDADIDGCRVLNAPGDCVNSTCSMSDNMKPSVFSLNLNSCPPVSPHCNLSNAVATYDFGPFGENQVPACSKRSEVHIKTETGYVQKHCGRDAREHVSLGCGDTTPRKPRKRACRSNSNSSVADLEKGNSISNMDMNVENSNNVDKDDLS